MRTRTLVPDPAVGEPQSHRPVKGTAKSETQLHEGVSPNCAKELPGTGAPLRGNSEPQRCESVDDMGLSCTGGSD